MLEPVPVTPTRAYEPGVVEREWQRRWREARVFSTPEAGACETDVYIFAACPFTSGNAHMGHVRSYTITDAYARFRRACGDGVLFSLGFDAFGLPSELGAIANDESPQAWVDKCCDRMRSQFDRLGFSFDWSRRFVTSEPSMYRWTQWLFLTLLERGLVYRGTGPVDWCDHCNTALASLQVEDGRCWRCHNEVRRVTLPQWILRISAYAEEAERDLERLRGWNRQALGAQRAVIGRVDGHELTVTEVGGDRSLTAFAPRIEPDAVPAFVAISPNHAAANDWLGARGADSAATSRYRVSSRGDRSAGASLLIETGRSASIPGTSLELPVIVTSLVDGRYGSSVVLGMPSVDQTDKTIAARIGLRAMESPVGMSGVTPTSRFRVRDFPISRQRAWGTPIPIVNCDDCGAVPVPLEDLPVQLESHPALEEVGMNLSSGAGRRGAECACPRCGHSAEREADTLDCHVDGLWFWMALCVPSEQRDEHLFTHPGLRRWLPIHSVIWGADGGGYMYDIRVVTKILRDAGVLDFIEDGEPFASVLMHEMVHMEGRKMSKHIGNVVSPETMVKQYGADTLRMAVLFAAAPDRSVDWTKAPLELCSRFLSHLWAYCGRRAGSWPDVSLGPWEGEVDAEQRRFIDRCEETYGRTIRQYHLKQLHRVTRGIMENFDLIQEFEAESTGKSAVCAWGMGRLLHLLTPIAPHIAEELWREMGGDELLAEARWWERGAS